MTIASLKSGQNAMATREVLASKGIRALIAHHLIRQIKTVPFTCRMRNQMQVCGLG
jgi:hypothetical protein